MYVIGGLPGAQVDLVNWLDDPVLNTNYQGFREGAKETYLPPAASNRSQNWSPVYSDISNDLLDSDLASDNLDDCLSLNLKDDNFHMQLSGEDAKWARGVAEDYKQLQQRSGRRRKQAHSGQLHLEVQYGQQQFDDGYSSNGPNDSPFQQYRDVDSPFSPISDSISSPLSEAYNSPEYCNFYTPEQCVNQNNSWDLEELDQNDINTLIKSESCCTSPDGQYENELKISDNCYSQLSSNIYNNEDSNKSYIIAFDNDNTSVADEATIEIGDTFKEKPAQVICSSNTDFGYNLQQSAQEGGWYGNNIDNSSPNACGSPERKTSLKDIITHEGDSILRDLISPITGSDGSQITARYGALSVNFVHNSQAIDNPNEDYSEVDFYPGKKAKRVPFTAEERKLRKKEQNKRAAIIYREKKKKEMDGITERYENALKLHSELEELKKKKIAEFELMQSLLLEKLRKSSE